MNILVIDTALDKSYIALSTPEGEIFKTIESDEKNYHSAYLIKVLNEMNALEGLEYIGVNTGMGSFTGIRTGLAIVKIFTARLNIKAVPFTTAEVLAYAFKNKNIMLDAKRNSVYYSNDGKNVELIPYDTAFETAQKTNSGIICDSSIQKKFNLPNFIPFEGAVNLAKPELKIVMKKIEKGLTADETGLKPTYIQTPPIFVINIK